MGIGVGVIAGATVREATVSRTVPPPSLVHPAGNGVGGFAAGDLPTAGTRIFAEETECPLLLLGRLVAGEILHGPVRLRERDPIRPGLFGRVIVVRVLRGGLVFRTG